jgi:hypothetical protein
MLFLLAIQAVMAKAEFGDAAKGLFQRQLPDSCAYWSSAVGFCKSVSPGFVSLPATLQAPCLCYDSSGDWIPDIFDSAVDSCASWAATSDVAEYTVVDSWQGLCTDAGPVLAAPSNTPVLSTPTPTPAKPTPTPAVPTTTPAPNDGCSVFSSVVASCNSTSPGFLTMDVTAVAECLCYTSTSWVPARFDGAAASCANVIKTAYPTDYQGFTSDFLNFCTDAGNVMNTPLTPTATRTTQSPKTTVRNTNSITPQPTTVVLGSTLTPSVSTKSSSGLRLRVYGRSIKVLGSSWLVVTLALALM